MRLVRWHLADKTGDRAADLALKTPSYGLPDLTISALDHRKPINAAAAYVVGVD
jgi:hypothetical protein